MTRYVSKGQDTLDVQCSCTILESSEAVKNQDNRMRVGIIILYISTYSKVSKGANRKLLLSSLVSSYPFFVREEIENKRFHTRLTMFVSVVILQN